MECRGLETGRVRWGLVGSGRVRASRVESRGVKLSGADSGQSIQVNSSQVESWSGVAVE